MASGDKDENVKVNCKICGKEFEVSKFRKNIAKYCSRKCFYKSLRNKGSVEYTCKNCGNIYYTSPSRNKSFCSKECKSEYELKTFNPKSFTCVRSMFKRRNWLTKCQICGYDEHPEILGIHHKDRNRKNNTLENLIVLCPNCHSLEHDKHICHSGETLKVYNNTERK